MFVSVWQWTGGNTGLVAWRETKDSEHGIVEGK